MNEFERGRAVAQQDNERYELLEQRGFKSKYYPRHRDGSGAARWDRYIGKTFTVIARVTPMNGFPMWVIEFADGFRMAANKWEVVK